MPADRPDAADNARTINLTAATVAGFRSPALSTRVPVITLDNPTQGATTGVSTGIWCRATANDPDGTVVRVDFLANGRSVGFSTHEPFAIWWTNATAGSYTLTARATDDLGVTTQSEPVTVTVYDLSVDAAHSFPLPDGAFQLRAVGQPGALIQIEGSANTTDWAPLATGTLIATSFDFVDYQATNFGRRFYRIRLLP